MSFARRAEDWFDFKDGEDRKESLTGIFSGDS